MTTEPERRYDAFAPALYRYCWSLVGPQAAEAALRRALLAAPRLAGELSDPDDLQPWLFALARTACRRHGFAAASPYAALAASAEERPVAQMLAGLPPSSREMLELHLRHGLTASQIAKVCGLDRETCGELCRAAERRAAELLPDPAAALALLEPPGPPPGLLSGPLGGRAEAAEAAGEMRPLGPDGFPLHRRREADRPAGPEAAPGPAGAAEEPREQAPRPLPGDRVTTADVGVPLRPEQARDEHRAWSWAAVSGLVTVALALMLSAAVLLSGPGTVAGAGPPPIGTGAPATARSTAPADPGDTPGEAPSPRTGPSAAASPGGEPDSGESGRTGEPGAAPTGGPSAPPAAPEEPAPEPSRTADPAPPPPEPSGTAPPPAEDPPAAGPVTRLLDGIARFFTPE
ncbi:hypothetical protein [Nocardiopsis potens]|uniref:hypothetical protein n=1 Tax=Nocardiopsis potens TaxID=1246458 RepID=UPI000345B44F|nr:hypothetical protein [Nocardiopsis potens]